MSGSFTRLGSSLWSWEPWVNLPDDAARMLWLALYTSERAKTIVPGLWHGSVLSMADAARQQPQDTYKNLDTLLACDLVEYDERARVLRLTELPDAGEWPQAPYILSAWWKRFLNVPACPVRNAHAQTVRWMLDRGAREVPKGSGKPSPKHEEIWSETFGTIPVVAARRRGVRRLCDSDTGNTVQGSLFAPSKALLLPEGPTIPPSDPEPSKINYSRSDPPSDRGGSGEGEGEGEGEISFSSLDPEPPNDRPIERPRLVLVPPPADVPFTADDLVKALGAPPPGLDVQAMQGALWNAIGYCGRDGTGVADLAVLRDWVSSGGPAADSIDRARLFAHAAQGELLADLFRRAAEYKQRADERTAAWQAAREQAGIS